MRDLYNSIGVVRAVDPVVGAGDNTKITSATIDMQGFRSLVWLISLGTLADAAATFVMLMEESDDSGMSGKNNVADVNMDPTEAIASFDEADDSSVRKIGYTGTKRYVTLSITPADNAGTWPVSIIALMGNPIGLPTPAQAT